MVRKIRSVDVKNYVCGVDGTYTSGVRIPGTKHKFVGSGSERLDSEGHPWNSTRRIPRGARGDIGGGFGHQIRTFRSFPALVDVSYVYGAGAGWYYSGELHASVLGKTYGVNQLPDVVLPTTLNYIGTKGIRNNPVKPQGDLGQFLGELHDLPKMVDLRSIASRIDWYRKAGDTYLNFQFGWVPFVKSLKDYFRNVLDADKTLRQLARDNGRYIRRSLNLPEEKDVNTWTEMNVYPSPTLVGYLYDSKPSYREVTERYQRNRWFRGRFRYWIPTMTTPSQAAFWSLEANQQRNRLSRVVYGASMTPDLIWQLTPWSWLLDWVGNIGDIVSNQVDIELNNLHIDYAYSMCRETKEKVWVSTCFLKNGIVAKSIAQDLEETKGRAASSPFGFGFDMSSMTPYQASIVAALGASKHRKLAR